MYIWDERIMIFQNNMICHVGKRYRLFAFQAIAAKQCGTICFADDLRTSTNKVLPYNAM